MRIEKGKSTLKEVYFKVSKKRKYIKSDDYSYNESYAKEA